MVRLNVPKHQRNAKKRGMMAMSNQLSSITHFGDITALTGGEAVQVCLRYCILVLSFCLVYWLISKPN